MTTFSSRARKQPSLPRRSSFPLFVSAVIAILVASAGFASASPITQPTAEQIADSLQASPVFVDSEYSGSLSEGDASSLAQRIEEGTTPIFIAALGDSTVESLGGRQGAVRAVERAMGRSGTYVVVDSAGFEANSSVFSVSALAQDALNGGGSAADVLNRFVGDVQDRASGASGSSGGSGGSSTSDSGGFPWVLALFGLLALGLVAVVVRRKRAAKEEAARKLADFKAVLEEDITALGEQMARVDDRDPRLGEEGRADLSAALASYDKARRATDRLASSNEAFTVTSALDDGRYAMSRVRARIDGHPVPERRPPCFFDPRHGSSSQDVMWGAPGMQVVARPTCASCAQTVMSGGTPNSRMVPVNGGYQPYYQAGPYYGPYAGGYYNSYGDAFTSIMVGTMIGNMMFGPNVVFMGGDMGASGVGDGGGDFGGGDFGGGGFDFGGGDFGF